MRGRKKEKNREKEREKGGRAEVGEEYGIRAISNAINIKVW